MSEKKINKIVLAYSGGLDTSVMLRWLKDQYQCEVVCYCADVGQGAEMDGLDEKAKATGASKLYIEDLREEFVRDYVWTAVKANAIYEGVYLMGTSLARPVIAKRQIEIARAENADAVAHGATGKGNDQVRFELTYYALQPDIKVIAPWRDWEFAGRTDLIAYAEAHGIPITATVFGGHIVAVAELSTHENQRVTKPFNDGIQAALNGTKTAEQAMKDAQAEAERILRQYR
jgi:argininosuccinate synthase